MGSLFCKRRYKMKPEEKQKVENLLKETDGNENNEYKKEYSNETFLDRVTKLKNAGAKLIFQGLLLFNLLKKDSSSIGASQIGIIIFGLGYFLSPLDVIPDNIPIVGFLDDAKVLYVILQQLKTYVTKKHITSAVKQMKKLFGIDYNPDAE